MDLVLIPLWTPPTLYCTLIPGIKKNTEGNLASLHKPFGPLIGITPPFLILYSHSLSYLPTQVIRTLRYLRPILPFPSSFSPAMVTNLICAKVVISFSLWLHWLSCLPSGRVTSPVDLGLLTLPAPDSYLSCPGRADRPPAAGSGDGALWGHFTGDHWALSQHRSCAVEGWGMFQDRCVRGDYSPALWLAGNRLHVP